MTIWAPRLQKSNDPIYARIADALERDVRKGVLVAGSQLPTHRDLARELGITPVTVTRAYSEAAKRGLVESSIGRGTFVRALRTNGATSKEIDLATNAITIPLPSPSMALLERAAATLGSNYAIGPGSERHRAAGAAWIGRRTDPARVVVTAGTQHALLLALAATTRPGDALFCESITYHGAKAAAALLNLRLVPLPLDRDGLRADAFERACSARTAKVLYTIPTLHNPTGTVMPEKRRREIAAIAEKYGIAIIEDDVCGFLIEKTPPPLAAFAPERTLFLTGLGKAIAPALRVGYLAAPEAFLQRVHAALAASVLFSSPLVAEIAASWIEDGTAGRIVRQKRAEASLRNRIARTILRETKSDPRSLHLWVELPRRWTPDAFAEEARRRRVRVASASSFAAGADVPRAIRISVGAPASVAELETALHTIMGIEEERAQEPVV
ncbi:MAG TPA: PLP-dependent aminotransferase family protein [Thermoanaerobaculia bacterium]|nr:PLP-dependent aminotransferase family protein [Thermoanaerobaculia bacterium]